MDRTSAPARSAGRRASSPSEPDIWTTNWPGPNPPPSARTAQTSATASSVTERITKVDVRAAGAAAEMGANGVDGRELATRRRDGSPPLAITTR